MSDKMFKCDSCQCELPGEKFSKSQINKLEHNKIKSVRCIPCTENVLAAVESERLAKIKQEKKELKKKKKVLSQDPSSLYIKNPVECPTVLDAENFFQSKNMEFKVNIGKTKEWRTVAKIAVRGILNDDKSAISTVFGLFKPGTHEVIECVTSPAHHVSINKAIQIVKTACVSSKVNGYVEGTGSSKADNYEFKTYLKYVILAVERATGKVQLSLVWNTETPGNNKDGDYFLKSLVANILKASISAATVNSKPSDETSTSAAASALDTTVDGSKATSASIAATLSSAAENPLFHSIFVNYNPSSRYNNAITGRGDDCWAQLFGSSEHVLETVATNMRLNTTPPQLRFPPYVFRQANIDAFTKIIRSIRNWIPRNKVDGSKITGVRGDNVAETGVFKGGLTPSSQVNGLVKCVELYGGVGTIGLNCVDLLSKLSCSDENPHNKVCFELTLAESLTYEHRTKASYTSLGASAVSLQGGLKGYDLVIVDPPRKGLDEEVIEALLDDYSSANNVVIEEQNTKSDMLAPKNNKKIYFGEEPAESSDSNSASDITKTNSNSSSNVPSTQYNKRLIYVSCGFKAFKRDCARLLGETVPESSSYSSRAAAAEYDPDHDFEDTRSHKRAKVSHPQDLNGVFGSSTDGTPAKKQRLWKLVHCEGHVLFPGSDHIETFAVFDRICE